MSIEYIDFLKEALEGLDTLNAEQVRKVLKETNSYFQSLETLLLQGNREATEQALTSALELKEYLDFKATNVAAFKGLETFDDADRDLAAEIDQSLSINNTDKTKIKKIKPTKLS